MPRIKVSDTEMMNREVRGAMRQWQERYALDSLYSIKCLFMDTKVLNSYPLCGNLLKSKR